MGTSGVFVKEGTIFDAYDSNGGELGRYLCTAPAGLRSPQGIKISDGSNAEFPPGCDFRLIAKYPSHDGKRIATAYVNGIIARARKQGIKFSPELAGLEDLKKQMGSGYAGISYDEGDWQSIESEDGGLETILQALGLKQTEAQPAKADVAAAIPITAYVGPDLTTAKNRHNGHAQKGLLARLMPSFVRNS